MYVHMYIDMGKEALSKALSDAGIPFQAVEQAAVGYVYGDSTCGQRALYEVGITGIPIYNVNNNCSTGSTALYMAYQFIKGGLNDCVVALGFEKVSHGLSSHLISSQHRTTTSRCCNTLSNIITY
jgi:acetyl-CoA acetyltransferase